MMNLTPEQFDQLLVDFNVQVQRENRESVISISSENNIFNFRRDSRNNTTLSFKNIHIPGSVELKIGQRGNLQTINNASHVIFNNITCEGDFSYMNSVGSFEINSCDFSGEFNVYGEANHFGMSIENSNIANLLLPGIKNTALKIRNSNFGRLRFSNVFTPSDLFIDSVKIEQDSYYTFRKFRLAAENIKDKIQSIELYNLELKFFIKSERWRFSNDWLIHHLNLLGNSHGRNFVLPLMYAYLINILFLGTFFCSSFSFETMIVALNINPLSTLIPEGVSGTLIDSVDATRRMLMTVFIYLTIGPLRKFTYKFPS